MFYECMAREYINSKSCTNSEVARKVVDWYGCEYFISNNENVKSKPIQSMTMYRTTPPNQLLNLQYGNSVFSSDVDFIIEALVANNINENQSSLTYLVRLINDEVGNNKLFLEYPQRKKGTLFEDTMAKVLFAENHQTQEADNDILEVLVKVLVRRVCDEFQFWFSSAANGSENYKLLAKYNNTVPPLNSPYFIALVSFFEADGFIDIASKLYKIDIDKVIDILEVDKSSIIRIVKNNKDEALLAIHGLLDEDNILNNGVFNFIAHHQAGIKALSNHKGDKELQIARLVNSKAYEDDQSIDEIWNLIAGMSLKSISTKLIKFIENERATSAQL